MKRQKKRLGLEAFRFAVYLGLPVYLGYFMSTPENIEKMIGFKQYVVYPPAQELPDISSKEKYEAYKKMREEKKERYNAKITNKNTSVNASDNGSGYWSFWKGWKIW